MKKFVAALLCFILMLSTALTVLNGCSESEESSLGADASESAKTESSEAEKEHPTTKEIKNDPEYKNVALDKTYTTSPLFTENDVIVYPDETGKELTDGVNPPADVNYRDPAFIGFNKGGNYYPSHGYFLVTLDLGELYYVDKFAATVVSKKFSAAGVTSPEFAWIYLSNDGENWFKAGRTSHEDNGEANTVTTELEFEKAYTARYIQYRFVGESNFVFVSEIEAYGIKAEAAVDYPENDTEVSILFIGNSTTFVHNMPIRLMNICEAAGINLDINYSCISASSLYQYADENDETHGKLLRQRLSEKKYDYIVVQDSSIVTYAQSKPALDILMPLFEENGAEVVLYKRYSDTTIVEDRLNVAYQHEQNYTKLAQTFNIEKVAPVADAFLICTEKYKDINLYHTDNLHHSKTGSYLIACVMAIEYFGIDIDSNSYLYPEEISEDTAKKLKECAKLACTEGYDYPMNNENVYTAENGTTYENIALNKIYTATGSLYDGEKWTDTGSDGKPLGKLTDGTIAVTGEDLAIGCYKDDGHTVTIDLNAIAKIAAVKTDMHGNEAWGITYPKNATITISVSQDGKSFTQLGAASASEGIVNGNWVSYDFLFEASSEINARYVRLTYNNGQFNWASEISVYGTID